MSHYFTLYSVVGVVSGVVSGSGEGVDGRRGYVLGSGGLDCCFVS